MRKRDSKGRFIKTDFDKAETKSKKRLRDNKGRFMEKLPSWVNWVMTEK